MNLFPGIAKFEPLEPQFPGGGDPSSLSLL
jgi:hypothetical protein